jgi:soluble lytic murein transglycosylase
VTSRIALILVLATAAVLLVHAGTPQQPAAAALSTEILTATAHPALPQDPTRLWFAPSAASRSTATSLARGVRLHADARYADALPLVRVAASKSLAEYARYYTGLTELRLAHLDQARASFEMLASRAPAGYLGDAARLRLAEIDELQGRLDEARGLYAELAASKGLAPEDVLMKLARTAQAAGDSEAAALAWARVYYDYPLSDEATLAQAQLDTLKLWQPLDEGSPRFKLELGRAERLFAARRYAQARAALEPLQPVARGSDAEITALRIAECDFYLKRFAAARDALDPWTRKASRRAEAQFFYLSALREVGQAGEYVRLSRELVDAWPQESWAEETLNNLATHYILLSDTDGADAVFREILQRYPSSRHAQRAAWKVGWLAYRQGRYADTIRLFEGSAARFPRSDYRPSWVYWASRAHDQLGDVDTANARYALVVTDYQNSYYGRLASQALTDRHAPVPAASAGNPAAGADAAGAVPPTAEVIRALIANELYDDAMNELQYAERAWGDSPAIQATMALVYSRQGDLRRGINAMKRAYPQYMAAGGEDLPIEMLKVLFPVAYWDAIKRHSKAHGLDPYLVAALTAQESTFDPEIRSAANAVGLMQVLPSTGRRYAKRMGLRRFRPSMLTQPETNLRLGTAIFADLVGRFGGVHLALASYNAGEGAVERWVGERPGLPRDEFIDDIPYPETQNYVKRIVGTAEDYRRLYGELGASSLTRGAKSSGTIAPAPASRSSKAHSGKTTSSKKQSSKTGRTKKKSPPK